MKPTAVETRRMPPFGSPHPEEQHDQNEAKRRIRVVRLSHLKTEAVPAPLGIGTGGIIRRSGFWSPWTARHRRSPSHRQPRLAKSA